MYALLLGISAAVAFTGVSIFWVYGPKERVWNRAVSGSARLQATGSRVGPKDLEALKEKIKQLESGKRNLERESTKFQDELNLLRSQLAELRQSQKTRSSHRVPAVETGVEAMGVAKGADASTDASELTPEDEIEQADEKMWAQADVIEDAIQMEDTDPEWSRAATNELDNAYRSEAMVGAELVSAECRTTLCRMELVLNGSKPAEETFRSLIDLAPWEGQGFVQMDDGEYAQAIVYFSREGYTLPQVKNGL